MRNGCVWYSAGELSMFHKDTVIQPDNQIPILYSHIKKASLSNHLEILGALPDDFLAKLRHAIQRSETMNVLRKENILGLLEPRSRAVLRA
jgi:hypothetical protein